MAHRSSWGAPIWPPTPPSARTRPGAAVARLGLATRWLIDRRGGPRYGPPHPPSLGRAPAQPWRASGLPHDGSSLVVGGPDMAPHTPHRSDAPRRSRGAPRACHTMAHRSSWGAPIWPPTPPIARTRPGAAVARLGLATRWLIARRGG